MAQCSIPAPPKEKLDGTNSHGGANESPPMLGSARIPWQSDQMQGNRIHRPRTTLSPQVGAPHTARKAQPAVCMDVHCSIEQGWIIFSMCANDEGPFSGTAKLLYQDWPLSSVCSTAEPVVGVGSRTNKVLGDCRQECQPLRFQASNSITGTQSPATRLPARWSY